MIPLLLWAIVALVPVEVGIAPYAIQHPTWGCNKMFERVADFNELRVAFLWNTFGRSNKCLDRVLADERLRMVEVHLVNDACTRNNNCGPYEFLAGMKPEKIQRLLERREGWFIAKYRAYALEVRDYLFPRLREGVACSISPFLEANVTGEAARNLLQETRDIFGGRCLIVWNPLHPSQLVQYGQDVSEHHGLLPVPELETPCIFNNDGSGRSGVLTVEELQAYTTRCFATFDWRQADNCRRPGKFVDPRKRVCQ